MAFYDGKNGIRVWSKAMADSKKVMEFEALVNSTIVEKDFPVEVLRRIRVAVRTELSARRTESQYDKMDPAKAEALIARLQKVVGKTAPAKSKAA